MVEVIKTKEDIEVAILEAKKNSTGISYRNTVTDNPVVIKLSEDKDTVIIEFWKDEESITRYNQFHQKGDKYFQIAKKIYNENCEIIINEYHLSYEDVASIAFSRLKDKKYGIFIS